jgi:hypothetical protein
MNGIIGEFRIGEDLLVALDATGGNAALASAISAAIKPATIGANRLVLDDAASGVALTISAQNPASAGWTLGLPASQTATMEPGIYGIDARLVVGSGIAITDQTAFVRLSRAALA